MITLTLLVLLGAIVNAAVAAVCALRVAMSGAGLAAESVVSRCRHHGEVWGSPSDDAEEGAIAAAFRMWPKLAAHVSAAEFEQYTIQCWSAFGASVATGFADTLAAQEGDPSRSWLQEYGAGWPTSSWAARVDRSGALRGGVVLPANWLAKSRPSPSARWGQPPIQAVIPVAPIWPGFAINTVFYAAILCIVFALPRAVRRLRRRIRGWCVHCGYDLRGQLSDDSRQIRCPECGRTA